MSYYILYMIYSKRVNILKNMNNMEKYFKQKS